MCIYSEKNMIKVMIKIILLVTLFVYLLFLRDDVYTLPYPNVIFGFLVMMFLFFFNYVINSIIGKSKKVKESGKRYRPDYTPEEIKKMESELSELFSLLETLKKRDDHAVSIIKDENPHVTSQTYINDTLSLRIKQLTQKVSGKEMDYEFAKKNQMFSWKKLIFRFPGLNK